MYLMIRANASSVISVAGQCLGARSYMETVSAYGRAKDIVLGQGSRSRGSLEHTPCRIPRPSCYGCNLLLSFQVTIISRVPPSLSNDSELKWNCCFAPQDARHVNFRRRSWFLVALVASLDEFHILCVPTTTRERHVHGVMVISHDSEWSPWPRHHWQPVTECTNCSTIMMQFSTVRSR